MAWEVHERRMMQQIASKVNPKITPEPDGSVCPTYHAGHGWWQYNGHRKMAYNELWRIRLHDVEEMYDEARARFDPKHVLVDAPFSDINGEEDDFIWWNVIVRNTRCLLSLRRREENEENEIWYDFCLTLFANHQATDKPDIS